MPSFETAVSSAGWGLYHYGLTGICGLSTMVEAMLNLSAIMILPLSMCELKIPLTLVFWINSALSFGMAAGGFIIGCLSDIIGRKCVIPLTLLVMFCGALGCSFSSSSVPLMFFMIVLGMGFGGQSLAARIYLAEILPQNKRGSQLVVLEMFWTIGCIVTVCIMRIMLPPAIYYSESIFRPSSWRIILAKGACFGVAVACVTGLLSGSPRFLLVKQRPNEAIEVLKHMFAINTCSHTDSYVIPNFNDCLKEDPEQNVLGASITSNTKRVLKRMIQLTVIVFNRDFRRRTYLCIAISIVFYIGMTMASIWAVRLVDWPGIPDEDTNSTNCYFPLAVLPLKPCSNNTEHSYNDAFTLYGSILAADIAMWIFIDVIGHTYCLGIFLIVSSACVLALSFHLSYLVRHILVCCFMASYAISDIAFTIVTIEIYPTAIRGTANGVIRLASRILCGLAKRFFHVTCDVSLQTLGGIMLIAVLLSLFLQNLTRKPMTE